MINLTIYTDGAYSFSLNQGGIGIIYLKNNKIIKTYYKAYKNTTNNRMELLAVIIALSSIKKEFNINIFTDSMYVIGGASKGWKRNKNIDLWKKLDNVTKKLLDNNCTINYNYVKGHIGNKYNEICDNLANKASQGIYI